MKKIKYLFTAIIAVMLCSCSDDDGAPGQVTATGDHTYDIEITSGFLAGKTFSGTVPNNDFYPSCIEVDDITFLSIGWTADVSCFGGVSIINGQPDPFTDAFNGNEGTSLGFSFTEGGTTYVFESTSGTCSVSNLQKYGSLAFSYASYTLNFSGTFRQANFDGPDEDKPLVQMSGTIVAKKVVD